MKTAFRPALVLFALLTLIVGGLYPALVTAIGKTAAAFIIARSEDRPVENPVCDIGFTIVERDSA